MNDILVTGGTGFVGSHMIDYILKYAIRLDQKIYSTKRWMEDTKNLDHVRRKDRLKFIDCDLLDAHSIRRAIEISKPEKVFHFAAQSFPEVSFKTPVITLQTNTVGTTNLLEAIYYMGSAASFRGAPTEALIQKGLDTAIIRAEIQHEDRELLVEAELSNQRQNSIAINKQKIRPIRLSLIHI